MRIATSGEKGLLFLMILDVKEKLTTKNGLFSSVIDMSAYIAS